MATTILVFRVDGMHCGSCALLIDDALEDLPGVGTTQTTVKQGRCTVELDADLSGSQDVIAVIEELGYRAVRCDD
ncbi:heavy-metal-associated domain-containing protein [Kibdelosporangium philippinense]|uniref:Heavy-metal-associated domain-containing protein n=1 Tax=Kibdelosporangium philippinense TaxID=211113 RepID=A0ABS8Z9L3_9PSEU|nr:heavy metal-associated domain-containing protein [Kibdelosporangium philippinense]MCE7004576.1 heavy-metal-associated domain-containing protein [Kibdelosporangium philippinense]